ncbi:MAG: hypothetical protein HS116_26525 [Planctomycetes bacterium]|nr:hypothetical protein [Planctomycetota bacterium]
MGRPKTRHWLGIAPSRSWILAPVLLAAYAISASEVKLAAEFGADGLTGLSAAGHAWLGSGQLKLAHAVLEQAAPDEKGFLKYSFEKLAAEPVKRTFDAANKTARLEFAWGAVDVKYAPGPDRLDLAVTLHNTSDRTLANFSLELLQLKLPAVPANWNKGKINLSNSLDRLAFTWANFEQVKLGLTNATMDPPVRFGLRAAGDGKEPVYALALEGGVYVTEPGSYEIKPHGLPRVAAGQSLTLEFTLRWMAADADGYALFEDVNARFRTAYGPLHEWKDRRPIGMLMRSSNYQGHKSATNPRGWFTKKELDSSNAEAFKAAALQDAKRCVECLKAMDAQGMVFWDVEGSENPHPITYIGDPRLAEKLAPDFNAVADEYFKTFIDAGLRTGICIRPTQVYFNEEKKKWDHGTGSDGGPGRGDHYSNLRAKDLPWWRFFPIVERMCDKIEYAKKRWGCTLFYIDTNGVFRPVGEDGKFEWMLLNAAMWKAIKAKHPDVLLVPELLSENFTHHVANHFNTAPYMELDLKGYGTPEWVRKLIPGSFSVVNVSDGDFAANREKLAEAVKNGDILMGHGWWSPKRNAEVKALYDEVVRGIAPPPAEPAKKTEPAKKSAAAKTDKAEKSAAPAK